MSLPLKAAAAAGVLTGGSLAGCYFGGVFSDTPWVSLKADGESSYAGKVGASYSIYLLSVHGNEGDKKDLNEAKWKELYRKYLDDSDNSQIQMSDEFKDKKVKSAYDSSTTAPSASSTALNKVCGEIYKKDVGSSGDVDFGTVTENKHKLAQDLLKYCSPLRKKPSTIGDNKGYPNNSLGVTKKDNLASALDSENYYFWQAQEKWFKGETEPKNDPFFKKFFYDGTSTLKTSMWKICHEAYGLIGEDSTPNETNPKKEDVEKYCSFKRVTP